MPSVSSSSAADGSAPSASSAPKKYIPPHLRSVQGGQSSPQDNSNYNRRTQDNRSTFQAGNQGSNSQPSHNYGYSGNVNRHEQNSFHSQNNAGSDRWANLDDRNFRHNEGQQQRYNKAYALQDDFGNRGGFMGSRNTRQSIIGTGWDVRDGRKYISESEENIFNSEQQQSTGINFDSYDRIPIEIRGRGAEKIIPIEHFNDLEVHELLRANVLRVKYSKPTPIQKHAIPTIVGGRDLMACAQTGSGKTAAFLYPIIASLLHSGPPPPANVGVQGYGRKLCAYPCCLVLSPTRELAVQTFEEARKFQFGTGIRTVAVYGGSEVKRQLIELDGGCDVCVATPGRLVDLLERKKIRLCQVQFFVLDEADRMLDMGFCPQIRTIAEKHDLPPYPGQCIQNDQGLEATGQKYRQTVMFSATFPREIQALAKDFMYDYIYLAVGRVGSTNEFIRQRLQYADEDQKVKLLVKLLGESDKGLTIIFVETKRKADLIEDYLVNQMFPAVSIHGDRSQQEREEALRLFKAGECPILVATDVAARGLDIPHVTHVINYDLPTNIDDYVHRIGRTGRAGNVGCATSFVNGGNKPILRDLLHLLEEAKQEIPSFLPPLVASCTSSSTRMGNKSWGGGGRGGYSGGKGMMRHDMGGGSRGGNFGRMHGDMRYEVSGGPKGVATSGNSGNNDWRQSQGVAGATPQRMGFQPCGPIDQRGTLDAW